MGSHGLQTGAGHSAVRLLLGYDREIAEWVRGQLDMSGGFGDCSAIGIVKDDKLVAGVVYYNHRPPGIEMAIASTTPKWCTRKILFHLFDYPFNQLGVRRITALVDSTNQPVRAFDERLGFVHEGTLRQGHPNDDAEIYGMLKSECRWINERSEDSGKKEFEFAKTA